LGWGAGCWAWWAARWEKARRAEGGNELGQERGLGHGGEREGRLATGPRVGARQGRGAGRPGWAG